MNVFLSVDPLAEDFPGWNPYHYVHNNPINLVDPTGMSAERTGDDIVVNRDKKGNVTGVERTYTGEDTPNRLFVQDPSATSDTPNRYEKNGNYYEQKLIPSSEYSEEDYKPMNGNPMNSSQFDKDRDSYITKDGGKYTDKNWIERLYESIVDDPITLDDIKAVFSKKGGNNSDLGVRKGERGQTARPDGTDNPFKKMKPDPSNSKRVIMKDANGKTKTVAKPEGFDAYWSNKKS